MAARFLKGAAKVTAASAATVAAAGAGGTTYKYQTDAGFRREATFWMRVVPIIGHYAWTKRTSLPEEHAALYEQLHARYAGPVLTLFTDLGGLYIKTGQYLSVRPEIVPTAFRTKLKTLQSDVPGRPYDDIVPIVEAELGPLAESFSSFSEEHIGAASIGQAHRATTVDGGNEVVVKVMYPDAEVNFKADLACIEGMINLGIYMEALDGDSMKGFFKEMQQQFMAELDFRKEVANLNEIRGSTGAAYEGRVVLPEPMMALSSQHVITMTYLEGPKLEDELLRRLKSLGIQSKEELRSMLQTTEEVDNAGKAMVTWNGESSAAGFGHAVADTFAAKAGYYVMSALGPGLAFRLLRNGEWLYSSASSAARSGVNIAGWLAGYGTELIPAPDPAVIDSHESARELIDTLLDVHGYQIFRTELFNADPHPGNIIVMENNVLGLIDYGQCKRLAGPTVRLNIAELIVAVAEGRADADIAAAFRKVGMRTVNDNDFFIANFARLLFGHFRVEMMDRAWHLKLHAADKMIEFPVDMIMVYRVAALLRGLSLSLQYDVAIGEAWYEHAKRVIELQADLDLNLAAAAAPTSL